MRNVRYPETRRQVGLLGPWNSLALDYRNPYVITFWSIAYAGLGHIILDRYIRGFVLMSGEIYLNLVSHMNLAIFYTLTRQYSLAKSVINMKAMLLYIGIYCFAIFDSYRDTILINNTYRLADRENAKVQCFSASPTSFMVLQRISPYLAVIWSAVIPGAGCFMLQRMNRAFYLFVLWGINAYLSGIYSALVYTAVGQFELAKLSLNIQWLLNLPSIWFYGMYVTYNCALENNKLYRRELTAFLEDEYQKTSFSLADVLRDANKCS